MNPKISLFVVALIGLALLSMPANAYELSPGWSKIQHDINNSGKINYTVGNYSQEFLITYFAAGSSYSTPVIDDNETIYIGDTGGFLRALNYDGSSKWAYAVGGGIITTPLLANNDTVYAVSSSGVLYAVNKTGGSVCSYNTGKTDTVSSPVIYNNLIFFASNVGDTDDRLFAINSDCTLAWTSGAFPNDLKSTPAINSSGGVYIGAYGYPVYAYDLSGNLLWRHTEGYADYTNGITVDRNGTIYYGEVVNGHLVAVNKDGTTKWSYNGGSGVTSIPAVDSQGNIYYVASTVLVKLNSNGNNVWNYNTGASVGSSSPSIDDNDTIHIGNVNGDFFAINSDGSLNGTMHPGGTPTVGSAISTRGVLYVPKFQGELAAYGYGNPAPPIPPLACCDPSGFVFDQLGNPVQGVKVVISNATYTDACLLTSCYTNAAGLWNGTITADGTYTINASKQGYTTNVTSQSLTIGGTANDIILIGKQATLTGHVYTTIAGTGTTSIKGNLQDLRVDACGTATGGGTLTIGKSGDGHTYVLKLIDVDSGNQQSVWQLLRDGSVLYDNQLVNTNQLTQLKIYETFYENVYVDIRVSTVFQGSSGEFNTAETCGSFEHVSKSPTLIDWLLKVAQDVLLAFEFTGPSGATVTAFSDVMQSTAGANTNAVFFNASTNHDAIGYADFQVNNPATIFNFNMALTAESTTGNAGKMEIGYTDDSQTQDNGFTDTILINSKQSCQANGNGYCTPQHDFKSVDANSNGIIRVWFKFDSGYSNFKLYEFYLNAWGTTTQQPLQGVNVYSVNGTNSTVTDALGAYTLLLSLKNNTVFYTKIGYESKNYTFLFNSTNVSFTQDVVLNATNGTINSTKEYITVPNFVQGTSTNGNFKTLSHTSLIGGYQIAICPQLGGNCKIQDVPANTESTFALDPNLAIGTYEADLTGYLGGLLDITREVIVSTNFTVTSSTPHVDWSNGADGYFLGDAMVLSVYVPSGTQTVSVNYITNGSLIYNNSFSTTGTVQNVTFQTNSNISLTNYQPGTYQGCITGGNCATTTLYNTSNTDYQVSSPDSVLWGTSFNILWKSPHTSTLQVVNQTNDIIASIDVGTSGAQGQAAFNTNSLANQHDTLRISLIRNSQTVANTTTVINPTSGTGQTPDTSIEHANTVLNNFLLLFTLPAVWGLIALIVFAYYVRKHEQAINAIFALAAIEAVMGLFDPFKWWVIAIVIIYAAIKFTSTRETVTGDK